MAVTAVPPTEKVTRLPFREDSFADLEDQDSSDAVEDDLSPPIPSSSEAIPFVRNDLIHENEQLRRHIEDLQAQVHHLLRTMEQSKGTPGVVLELPRAMKAPRLPALNCLRKSTSKDHQSLATDDDQSTVEPTPDLDVYESAKGLKNRQAPPKLQSILPSSPAERTRKTEPLSSNDGSLSSEEEECQNEHHPRNNQDNEDDYDDDEGDGIDMESRQLLQTTLETRSSTPRTRTRASTRTRTVEEEPFWRSVSDRAGWLVGLLVLQSMSSFILARNEALLQKHLVIVRFLTMLVGAGGNAGNQASVRGTYQICHGNTPIIFVLREMTFVLPTGTLHSITLPHPHPHPTLVIRGLAVGTINDSNARHVLKREFFMGAALSLILGTSGFIRAAVFMTPWLETVAITASLYMIVIISIVLGAMMPLGMKIIGIDPAHSSTTIQVVMDILGVSITVWMSSLVLDSGFQSWLMTSFVDAR